MYNTFGMFIAKIITAGVKYRNSYKCAETRVTKMAHMYTANHTIPLD